MNYRLLLCTMLVSNIISVAARETLQDSASIHFRQSKITVDTAYMNNRRSFNHINQAMKKYHHPDSNFVLLGARIIGGASPEGGAAFNYWLSQERAKRIYEYMQRSTIIPDSLNTRTLLGRDWSGLRALVVADVNVPSRNEVLAVLDNSTEDGDETLAQLKRVGRGTAYKYLFNNMFPKLRESTVVLTFGVPAPPMPQTTASIPLNQGRTYSLDILPVVIACPKQECNFYMALKSNMIADALALPEIGVEFYLGKNISIVGNWMYGWWDNDREHRYWRAYGGDIALRWWFGEAARRKPLTGHHLGVYGGVVTYDFEFGGKGYMGGRPGHNLWDRCMKYGGVEYGYSLPIARRFNIDFTFGLGYMGGKYIEYVPENHCYVWEATKNKHWFGPTKLEVSMTWLIGHGNYNKTKKGDLK